MKIMKINFKDLYESKTKLFHVGMAVFPDQSEPIRDWFLERNIREINVNLALDVDDQTVSVVQITGPSVYAVWFVALDADCDFWFDDKQLAMEFKLRFG